MWKNGFFWECFEKMGYFLNFINIFYSEISIIPQMQQCDFLHKIKRHCNDDVFTSQQVKEVTLQTEVFQLIFLF